MITSDILLIEDVSSDAKLISIALNSTFHDLNLRISRNGESGINELYKKRPDLLFLDLNIPKKSGIEVIKDVRSSIVLRTLPIIVITNSTYQYDVDSAYGAGCNAYIRKPVGFDKLIELMKIIHEFWFNLVTIP